MRCIFVQVETIFSGCTVPGKGCEDKGGRRWDVPARNPFLTWARLAKKQESLWKMKRVGRFALFPSQVSLSVSLKNVGDHRHEDNFYRFSNSIILRMHTPDYLSRGRDHTPAVCSDDSTDTRSHRPPCDKNKYGRRLLAVLACLGFCTTKKKRRTRLWVEPFVPDVGFL